MLVALALLALLLGGGVGVTVRMLAWPEASEPPTSSEDGRRAQQKLFELGRPGRRGGTLTLSEAEVNALLARHLVEAHSARLAGLSAKLIGGDRLEVRARSSLSGILDEASLGTVATLLPERWQARPVRLRIGGHVRVEEGPPRQLRMDVDEFAIGRQRLPTPALRLLVDPAAVSLLRWRLPEHIERVGIEPGRVVIRTAS